MWFKFEIISMLFLCSHSIFEILVWLFEITAMQDNWNSKPRGNNRHSWVIVLCLASYFWDGEAHVQWMTQATENCLLVGNMPRPTNQIKTSSSCCHAGSHYTTSTLDCINCWPMANERSGRGKHVLPSLPLHRLLSFVLLLPLPNSLSRSIYSTLLAHLLIHCVLCFFEEDLSGGGK